MRPPRRILAVPVAVAASVAGCGGGGGGPPARSDLRVALREAGAAKVRLVPPVAVGAPRLGRVEALAGSRGHVVAGTRAGEAFLSVDRGRRWRRVLLPGASVFELAALPGLLAWPDRCRLIVSRDAGRTRRELPGPTPGRCRNGIGAVAFADTRHGFALSGEADGLVVSATDDGGRSWGRRARPAAGSFDEHAVDDLVTGFAASGAMAVVSLPESGRLLITRDRGRTWAVTRMPPQRRCGGVAALGDELWLMCSTDDAPGAAIVHSTDAGRHWRAHASTKAPAPGYPGSLVAVAPGRALAVAHDEHASRATATATAATLFELSDGGATWRQVRPALPRGAPLPPPALRPVIATGGPVPRPAAGPVARAGRLAGVLIVEPPVVAPGATLTLAIDNLGPRTLTYGLSNVVQRRIGGRWRDARRAIFGTRTPRVLRIALHVRPGRSAAARADRIVLPRGLAPGLYRVIKTARDGPVGRSGVLRMTDTFRVVAHGAPRPVPGALGRCAGYQSVKADVDGDGRTDVVTFDAQQPDAPFIPPRDHYPGDKLLGVCTATGAYDHISQFGTGLEVADLDADGRDELIPSGAGGTARYYDVVVFRDGRLRKVTGPDGHPFEGFSVGGSDTRGGRTIYGTTAWGCRDANGARGIVDIAIRRGRGDRGVLHRTTYRLRGSTIRRLSRSTRIIRHLPGGGRGAAAYVSACPTRSIYDP